MFSRMSVLKDILEKGYVDQEILNALDEEQKQMLFIQMRQEQLRKYQAYEERLDRDGLPAKDKNKKSIRWQTGADGDVWVWVMGDHPADKTIDDILEEEARREAHLRALQELDTAGNGSAEEALKEQLGNLRVGCTDSMYDEADTMFDGRTPLLFAPPKSALKSQPLPEPELEANEPMRVTTTISSYSTPTPQVAVVGAKSTSNGRGPPPPIPTRPAILLTKSKSEKIQPSQTDDPRSVASITSNQSCQFDNVTPTFNGVKLRSVKALTPEEASEEVNKRESEIFQSIQEKREQIRREAESEAERQRIAWEEQERKSREAEAQIRTIAQKAREQHRQLLRTSTSILPALKDTKATSLREAIKNLPRPPKPKNRAEIIRWFKTNELPRGTGLDPKTSMPAPWFHGIISRDAAEQLLEEKPTGSFLVRISERIWGYTVSYVVGSGSCKHFLIERIEQGYQFLGTNQIVHDNLFDLISYHESAPITAKGGEILKWSVGQIAKPADFADLMPEVSSNNNYFGRTGLVGRF